MMAGVRDSLHTLGLSLLLETMEPDHLLRGTAAESSPCVVLERECRRMWQIAETEVPHLYRHPVE